MDNSLQKVFKLIDEHWNGGIIKVLTEDNERHEPDSAEQEKNRNSTKTRNATRNATRSATRDATRREDRTKTKKTSRKVTRREKENSTTDKVAADESRERKAKTTSAEYDPYDYLSYIPLHNRQPGKMNVSPARLAELRKDHVIDRGPWVSTEVKILQQNWARIVKHHPERSDPRFAFGDGHDQEGTLNAGQIVKLYKEYKRFQIMRRMALGLNDRLICDIYKKCRILFYDRSFRYHSRRDLPKYIEKAIKKDLRAKMKPYEISYKYDVSMPVIALIKRYPKKRITLDTGRFLWTPSAIESLQTIVANLYSTTDITAIKSRSVKWKKVAKEMRSCGFKIKRTSCQAKWMRMFPQSITRRPTWADESDSESSSGSDTEIDEAYASIESSGIGSQ